MSQAKQSKPVDFFQRALPTPYRILGLQLLPLSLGRYYRLKRHDIAFVSDGNASAEMGDLLLGILICSMTCEEFDSLSISNKLESVIKEWSNAIAAQPRIARFPFLYRLWDRSFLGRKWRTNHSFNVVEKMQLFNRYITEAQQIPKYWDEQSSSSQSNSHWSHSIEVVLRSELGWSLNEINETPLAKALADYFKHAENQGSIRLMSDEEINAPSLTDEQLKAFSQLGGTCQV